MSAGLLAIIFSIFFSLLIVGAFFGVIARIDYKRGANFAQKGVIFSREDHIGRINGTTVFTCLFWRGYNKERKKKI